MRRHLQDEQSTTAARITFALLSLPGPLKRNGETYFSFFVNKFVHVCLPEGKEKKYDTTKRMLQ